MVLGLMETLALELEVLMVKKFNYKLDTKLILWQCRVRCISV